MIAAGLTGLVAGWLFGLRFRVAIVVLAEVLALIATVGLTLTGVAGWVSTLEGLALFSTCLQSSYLLAVASPVAVRRFVTHHHVEA